MEQAVAIKKKKIAKFRETKIDFAHRSGALARPGSRELRAVKIPASYDAWRPLTRRKNDSEKIRFFGVSEISFFMIFPGFWRGYTILDVKISFLVTFYSR